MDDKEKTMQVEQWLRLIERTRLFCNTTDELGKMVGFSVNNRNSLARKGGSSLFMKDAIFRELAHIAAEDTGLDLQDVLDAYIEADKIIDKLGIANPRQQKDADAVCQHLIWHFYGDEEVTDDIAAIVGDDESPTTEDESLTVAGRHVPILVLMLQKALPRLSAKGGDVKDIAGDYRRMLSLLTRTVCQNITMEKLPLLSQMEEEVIRNPEKMCRLHLIEMTNSILNSYGSLSTLQRVTLSNQEFADNQFDPEVEGVWTEDDDSTVFWQFEGIANGYNLFRYSLNSERKTLEFVKYFAKFYHTDYGPMTLVLHPHTIHYLLTGRPLPNNLFAYLDCTFQDGVIRFTPRTVDCRWLNLRQLQHGNNVDRFSRLLEDSRYEKTNLYPDDAYDFTLALKAITNDDIFIKKDEATCYKVPKALNSLLEEVTFKSTVGTIVLRGEHPRTFLAFDDSSLYYDVTTEKDRSAKGIEIVEFQY